jgi:membrane-bound lytic murein transglycosylase D
MTPEEFRALNPQFNRPIIVGAAAPTLLLPADRLDVFNANLAAWESTGQPLASWTTYRLQPTDTLATVAKRAGITEQQLREANRVPPRYRLAAGSTILIPRDETMDDIPAHSLDAQFALVPEASNLRKVTYRVRRGDTLYSVARRYNVSEHDVILWNNLTGPGLFAGQRLELTIPMARSRATPKSTKASAKPARHPAATHTSNQATPKSAKGAAATHGKVAAASR